MPGDVFNLIPSSIRARVCTGELGLGRLVNACILLFTSLFEDGARLDMF